MSVLRESVTVNTPGGDLHGELFISSDGLPELMVDCGCPERYRPWTLPAAWTVYYQRGADTDILIYTWSRICSLRDEIRDAQREAESEATL